VFLHVLVAAMSIVRWTNLHGLPIAADDQSGVHILPVEPTTIKGGLARIGPYLSLQVLSPPPRPVQRCG
jgi:hypothetical protein